MDRLIGIICNLLKPVERGTAAAMIATVLTGMSCAEPPAPILAGYVHQSADDVNFGLYTHLCHAFVVPDETGRLIASRRVPDARLVKAAHAHGVNVLLSTGGWGPDAEFAAVAASEPARRRFIAELIALVEAVRYDGIDLDWEYPDTPEEAAGWAALARELRAELDALGRRDGRTLLLTMAASADPDTLSWLDREVLLENFDWLFVMTYDYAAGRNDVAACNAPLHSPARPRVPEPLSIEESLRYLVEVKQIDPQRLVVGIPLYGRQYPAATPYKSLDDATGPIGEAVDYRRLHRWQASDDWTRHWDDDTRTPWLVARDQSRVVSYDDAQSATLKARWALENQLRGVFFWQVAGDRLPDGSNPVQTAARDALLREKQSAD